jgi:hypothetical protein
MHIRFTVVIAAFVLFGTGSTESLGQTTATLDDCRAKAISQGLVGEARNKAITDCLGRPLVEGTSTATGARFATCRTEARGRFLSGDAYGTYLEECMAQSGAAESGGRATYQDCRSRAIARGLSGEAQGEFIDSCLKD